MTVNFVWKKNLAQCHVIQKYKGFARGEFKISIIQGIQGSLSLIFKGINIVYPIFPEEGSSEYGMTTSATRAVAADKAKACRCGDPTTPLEMDRPHSPQSNQQHQKPCSQMEIPGKEEEWQAKKDDWPCWINRLFNWPSSSL